MLNVNNLTGFGVSGGGDSGFSELFKIKAVDYVAVAIATKKYKLVTMTRPDYSTARNGNEVIIGTAGDNSIGVFLSNNDYVIAGGAGNDSINLDYTRGNVIAMGDAGNNHVYGSSFTGKNIFVFTVQTSPITANKHGYPSFSRYIGTDHARDYGSISSGTLEIRCRKSQFDDSEIKADILAIKKWVEENPNSSVNKKFDRLNLQIRYMDKITFRYIEE